MFEFIPAIDLLDGNVVRLFKGRYDEVTKYNLDPVQIIREYIDAGVGLVHIVDLNAARDGKIDINKPAIQRIREALGNDARMEIGGGIRDIDIVKDYLELGVDRVIIGTAAVKDPGFVVSAVNLFGPEKIIVGVDCLDGRVRVSGWQEDSNLRVDDFILDLEKKGIEEIIFTEISRDGAMSGPAINELNHILSFSKLRLIASGGVSCLADLSSLLNIRNSRLVGAISGKAVYEKKIDVLAAVKLCKSFYI